MFCSDKFAQQVFLYALLIRCHNLQLFLSIALVFYFPAIWLPISVIWQLGQ